MGFGYWVFADRASDALIGMGGLSYFGRGIPELEGRPEAGWAFDADHWGSGYATEALTAAPGWADANPDAGGVRRLIDLRNEPSERVAAERGFPPTGAAGALGRGGS